MNTMQTHRHFMQAIGLGSAVFTTPGAFAEAQCAEFASRSGGRAGEFAAEFDLVMGYTFEA
jgi:hypothetical protein